MQTFLLLGLGIVTIFVLARMNRSNKLFWILILSMLAGFMGGTIASEAKTLKNTKFEISVNPTQTSMCSLQATLDGTNEQRDKNAFAKSEGQEHIELKLNGTHEIIANICYQPSKPFDTS